MKILNISNNYHHSQLWRNMQKKYEELFPRTSCFVSFNKYWLSYKNDLEVYDYPILNLSDRIFFFKKISKCYSTLISDLTTIGPIDCVHAHTLFSDGGVAYRLWKSHRIPYGVSIRDTDINAFYRYKPYLKPYANKILKDAKFVVCLSPSYKDYLLRNIYCSEIRKLVESKIRIIPNGIDDFWFDNQPDGKTALQDDVLSIVSVGQICKRKNQLAVVRACEILRSKGFRVVFHLIGKIVDENYSKKIMGKNYIKYHGTMSKEELCSFYRTCDMLVLPSIHETFGLVYAEALSQGVPVIYSNGQGFDGQFPDGVVGYGVDAVDPQDLATKILLVKENLPQLSQNAIDACRKFEMMNVVNEFYKLNSMPIT